MKISLTFTSSRKDTLTLERESLEFEDFTEVLSHVETGEKDGTAIIPAIFNKCPPEACRNEGKPKATNCHGGRFHRLGANVASMTGFGVDIDDQNEDDIVELIEDLRAKGLCFWVWETYGHAPPENARARILIPFNEPMPITSASMWSKGAWPALVRILGLDDLVTADEACSDPARVYYLPRKPGIGDERESGFFPGEPLNWKEVLGDTLEAFSTAAAVPSFKPPEVNEKKKVNLDELRRKLRGTDTKNRPQILRVLRGEAPSPPPGKRTAFDPPRYLAWRAVASTLAAVADDWMSSEALLQVLAPAWQAEAFESPGDHTPWETVVHLLDTARAGMPAYRAQKAAEEEAEWAVMRRILRNRYSEERVRKHELPPISHTLDPVAEAQASAYLHDGAGIAPILPEIEPEEEPEPEAPEIPAHVIEPALELEPAPKEFDWTEDLERIDTKAGPKLAPSSFNVAHILLHHPEWKGKIRLDEYTQQIDVLPCPLSKTPTRLRDSHIIDCINWFAKAPGIEITLRDQSVWPRLLWVADANRYDSLKDEIRSYEWDGISRIHTVLETYFGAETTDETGKDIKTHIETISKRFMLSCVARALEPGCKVDSVLELEGSQGLGKTTGLRALAGAKFFDNTELDFSNKDALVSAGTNWIIELGERSAMNKAEKRLLKGFMSRQVDKFRPPYGRSQVEIPRRCVFAATTNESQYLDDMTGNRRNWVVKCVRKIDVFGLKRDRELLWAEAREIYLGAESCKDCIESDRGRCAFHRWWLGPEEEVEADEQAEARMEIDSREVAILTWWQGLKPDVRPRQFSVLRIVELLNELKIPTTDKRIGMLLKRCGFFRCRRKLAGKVVYHYEPTPELLALPHAPIHAQSRFHGVQNGARA